MTPLAQEPFAAHATPPMASQRHSVRLTLTLRDKGERTELGAVNECLSELEGRCIAKAECYAIRKAAREAEIAGLKEGLAVLERPLLCRRSPSTSCMSAVMGCRDCDRSIFWLTK